MTAAVEPVLIVSPRYSGDLAAMVGTRGLVPRIEPNIPQAADRYVAEPCRIVVVDARGALAPGLHAARQLGPAVEARRGALLVLLSRKDGPLREEALAAGATGVLVSPFGSDAFRAALQLAERHANRLAEAATGTVPAAVPEGDRLTGLATGEQLESWLAALLSERDVLQPVAVVALGVGRFAQINAAYGRDVADRLLGAVARRLVQIVDTGTGRRRGEVRLLARLAAAEFAIAIGGHAEPGEAIRLGEALMQAFERPFVVGDRSIHLAGRAGIADGVTAGSDTRGRDAHAAAAALVRQANAALAVARSREAGQIELFRADPAGDPLTRLADLEADLHRALGAGDISIRYQPQLALASGRLAGVEALVRWEHPEFGLLPAATLLETAAAAELAVRLGSQIRAQAIGDAGQWRGPLATMKLSLNVTAADLAHAGFVPSLIAALAKAGLPPSRLLLEVTEDALIDDLAGAARLLDLLRQDGVAVALDDFGTGYSSLARLARLPIDAIKLDRSFTQALTGSARERLVVESIVQLAHRLGLTVTAEGVENDGQLAAARAAGCDQVQGFRVAAPLDAAALAGFCADWTPPD